MVVTSNYRRQYYCQSSIKLLYKEKKHRNKVSLNMREKNFRWKWMLRAHMQWGIYCQRCYLNCSIISTSLFTLNSSPVPLKRAMAFISFHGEWAAFYMDGIEFIPVYQFFFPMIKHFKVAEKISFMQYIKWVWNGLDKLFSKIKKKHLPLTHCF